MIKKLLIILLLCSTCLGLTSTINSFNAGELSPYLDGRTDIAKYYSGCRTLDNFLILTYGGATKRPGTKYIATTSGEVRLVPFEFSTEQAYILEFGDEYLKFYKNGGQILSGSSAYSISTTYDTNTINLMDLQFVQSADTMYIVHSDYMPRKLTRTSHTDWTITDANFERGPFLDENKTDTTITVTGSTTIGSTVTLDSSTDIWDVNHVGALWQISHTIEANSAEGSFTSDGNSISIPVYIGQKYDFSTHGIWIGTITLQRSYDGGTVWKDVLPVHYEGDGNIQYSESEQVEDAIYRLTMDWTSGTCNYSLIARSYDLDGVVKITAFTDGNTVTGTVRNTLGGTAATKVWAEGAWSTHNGFPAAVAIYEERMVYAGTKNNPQTIWFSQTDDWENFRAGTLDADSFNITIASDQVNVIRWMVNQSALMVGTSGGEWKISSSANNEAITPANRTAKQQSSYGSVAIQPALMSNTVLFVQRQAKKVRELTYSFELDAWVAPDLTVLSDHITGNGIIQVAFQKTPDPMLWCVTSDGYLANMTYNREQDVVAWQKETFGDDTVKSAAVIPGTGEDEIWVVIERNINGSEVEYIEQFQPRNWGTDANDIFYVDSGLTYDGGATKTITAISKASPAIVIAAAHGFTDGEQVRISGVVGMTQVNNKVFTVDDATTNTFTLRDKTNTVDINSIGFSTYLSGGSVIVVENAFTGLDHLEGRTVQVIGDGGYIGTETVSGGAITLDDYYNVVHAGLGYTAKLLPERLEIAGQGTESRTKRITAATIRFYQSLGCDVGTSWTQYESLVFRDASDPLEKAVPLFNGDKKIDLEDDYGMSKDIYLQSRLPLPCNILFISPEWEIGN